MSLRDRSAIQGYVIGVADVRLLDPSLVPMRVTVNRLAERWPLIGCDRSPVASTAPRANAVPAVADWTSITSPFEANRCAGTCARITTGARPRRRVADAVVEVTWLYGAPYRGGGAFIPDLRVHVLSAESADRRSHLACTVTHPCTIGSIRAPIAALTVSVLGRVRVADADQAVRWALTVYGDGTTTAPSCHLGSDPM